MSGAFVVVRLPSDGTLVGKLVAEHPGARLSCVSAGTHRHERRQLADHVALVEGIPEIAIARMLLAWRNRNGEAPQVLGGPFALRLPVDLGGAHSRAEAACLRLGASLPDPRQVVTADAIEVWSQFPTQAMAELALAGLRESLQGMPVLSADVERPRRPDLEAWSVLQEAAATLVPDCLAAS